jgi:hypothetical protein
VRLPRNRVLLRQVPSTTLLLINSPPPKRPQPPLSTPSPLNRPPLRTTYPISITSVSTVIPPCVISTAPQTGVPVALSAASTSGGSRPEGTLLPTSAHTDRHRRHRRCHRRSTGPGVRRDVLWLFDPHKPPLFAPSAAGFAGAARARRCRCLAARATCCIFSSKPE